MLYPLARLFANFKSEVVGFSEYPTLAPYLRSVAAEHQQFYKKNALHYASLVRDESEAYKALTEISNDPPTLRKHIKWRNQMFRMFDQSFQQPEDERKLLEWMGGMAKFLTDAYKEEVETTMASASRFWLTAMKRFEAAHKKRIMHFPEAVDEE